MKISRLPKNDQTNGWSRILAPRDPHPELTDERAFDWAVVGAGYSGLAAARRLAENCPQDSIALIEAGEAGENASGRNSGFAIDLPHTTNSKLGELSSSQRYVRIARAGVSYLEHCVQEGAIECDWKRAGKLQAAVTERGASELLEPFARELEALGEEFRWVEKDELRDRIGTSYFHRAIRTEGCVLMNPAALTRGLADTMPENVTVFENSPVTETDYRNGIQLKTPKGVIRARKLILATNGFTERFGFFKGKFLHMSANASITRPLTEAEQKEYGVTRPWGLTPVNGLGGVTMRYTSDRRILMRQNIEYNPQQDTSANRLASVARHHKALFDARFPMLPKVDMEYTWTGYLCISRNGAPAFGQQANNVWSAACQNGIGVAKGTMNGLLAADLASGRDNPLIGDMEELGTPAMLPPRPILDVGVRTRIAWEVWKNRHEA